MSNLLNLLFEQKCKNITGRHFSNMNIWHTFSGFWSGCLDKQGIGITFTLENCDRRVFLFSEILHINRPNDLLEKIIGRQTNTEFIVSFYSTHKVP